MEKVLVELLAEYLVLPMVEKREFLMECMMVGRMDTLKVEILVAVKELMKEH